MNRPKSAVNPSPTPAIPICVLLERSLVGALAALVVARPLVSGSDPGRLLLTTGGGPVSFNFCVMLLLVAFAVWRLARARTRSREWPVVALLIAGIGVAAFVSARMDDRYFRPGLFIAWEWIAIAVAVYLTRRMITSAADNRGLLNVILASAVSIAGLGLYQALTPPLDLPPSDVVAPSDSPELVGNDEFYPELNKPPVSARTPRGTFDSATTLLAFLVLVFPVTVVAAWSGRAFRRGRLAVVLPVVVAAGGIAAFLAKPFAGSIVQWTAAIDALKAHPWLGVGPGNLSRMTGAVREHGAWVELAATMGIISLVFLAGAFVVAIWRARPASTDHLDEGLTKRRLTFHIGGAAGLVLGFVWSVGEIPPEAPPAEIFKLGGSAVFRAILWFAALGFLEAVRPSPRATSRAIVVGVVIMLLLGLISNAPGHPAILFTSFVLLVVAASFRFHAIEDLDTARVRPMRVVGVFLAAVLAVAYLLSAGLPAWATASAIRQARMASRHFAERDREVDRARPGPARATALTNVRNFLVANIINPLTNAAERDPRNAALWLEVARWRRPQWRYQVVADPEDAARVGDRMRIAGELAGKLDPNNPAAKRNLFESMMLFRSKSNTLAPERLVAINKLIGQIAEKEPKSEVPLRYRLVRMLLESGDAPNAKAEISTLLRLNRVEGWPHGNLTPEQKAEIVEKAIKTLPKQPKEVLDEWTR